MMRSPDVSFYHAFSPNYRPRIHVSTTNIDIATMPQSQYVAAFVMNGAILITFTEARSYSVSK